MNTAPHRAFFSWQSDTDEKLNRYLIRKALERAARQIARDAEIAERLEVDQATEGLSGAPSIADSILSKIDSADAFIADVSVVSRSEKRSHPNPNVMIELGYAMHALGHDRVIMIANAAYGAVEELPFDIRGRRVMQYELRAGDTTDAALEQLVGGLKFGLSSIMKQPRTSQDATVDVGAFSIVALDSGEHIPLVKVEVRNHSTRPIYLSSLGYINAQGRGIFLTQDYATKGDIAFLLTPPIEPGNSRVFTAPFEPLREHQAIKAIAYDRLNRQFASPPGQLEKAIVEEAKKA